MEPSLAIISLNKPLRVSKGLFEVSKNMFESPHESLWDFLGIHEGFDEFPWASMSLQDYPWFTLSLHELSESLRVFWNPISLFGYSWVPCIPWYSKVTRQSFDFWVLVNLLSFQDISWRNFFGLLRSREPFDTNWVLLSFNVGNLGKNCNLRTGILIILDHSQTSFWAILSNFCVIVVHFKWFWVILRHFKSI